MNGIATNIVVRDGCAVPYGELSMLREARSR
jgi:hypothetical protein